jgi:hypothetical protein
VKCICRCKGGNGCGGPVAGESSYCIHCQQGECHRADGPVRVLCEGCAKGLSISADQAFYEGTEGYRCPPCWEHYNLSQELEGLEQNVDQLSLYQDLTKEEREGLREDKSRVREIRERLDQLRAELRADMKERGMKVTQA